MLRRTFLGVAGGAAAAFSAHLQGGGIRLGMDAYSLRSWHWKAPQLLDYAISLRLDAIQFSNLHEFETLDGAYLTKLRDRAGRASISLELGIGSICPSSSAWNPRYGAPLEYLKTAVDVAKGLGAAVIRTYLGGSAERQGTVPIEHHIDELLKVLRAAKPLMADTGIRLAIENHNGDLLAREVRDIIEAAGKDWTGCCLDTGNPMSVLEDPLLTLEILGPYTLTTHIRDSVLYEHPRGAAWQWVPLGEGIVDWRRFVDRFRQLCPRAAMLLENITGRPPHVMPFFEHEFWKPFANVRASDFAAYVALARRGHPLMNPMVVEDIPGYIPQAYKDALKQQQKDDLEEGLEYAKKTLGVGINWKRMPPPDRERL